MNVGKRYLRNTVFTLWCTAAAFVGWTRLYGYAVDESSPQWKRSAMSLGLFARNYEKARPELDLATAKDFTKVSAFGNFTVEIVGAEQYKVIFTPPAGTSAKVHANLDNGYLRVHTDDTVMGGTLHIEVPTLDRIDANVPQITVSGLRAKEVALVGYRSGALTLRQNQVASWRVFSGEPFEVRMDDATFAAGTIKANGDVVIRRNN